jgi:hypothetical protein
VGRSGPYRATHNGPIPVAATQPTPLLSGALAAEPRTGSPSGPSSSRRTDDAAPKLRGCERPTRVHQGAPPWPRRKIFRPATRGHASRTCRRTLRPRQARPYPPSPTVSRARRTNYEGARATRSGATDCHQQSTDLRGGFQPRYYAVVEAEAKYQVLATSTATSEYQAIRMQRVPSDIRPMPTRLHSIKSFHRRRATNFFTTLCNNPLIEPKRNCGEDPNQMGGGAISTFFDIFSLCNNIRAGETDNWRTYSNLSVEATHRSTSAYISEQKRRTEEERNHSRYCEGVLVRPASAVQQGLITP